jgi:hypothetical protein
MLTASACSSATSTGGPLTLSESVPVVSCTTTHGVPPTGAATFRRDLVPTVRGIDPTDFAYYTDDARQIIPVLGPRGWRCHVTVAADGGESFRLSTAETSAMNGIAINAQREVACQGCVYSLVCAFIPAAKQQVGGGLGACPTSRAANERIRWIKRGSTPTGGTDDVLRYFFKGDGPGGGVVIYHWDRAHGGVAATETCSLDGTAAADCGDVLRDFELRNERSL